MQRLEVSGAVRPIYGLLGVKRLTMMCCFKSYVTLQGHWMPGSLLYPYRVSGKWVHLCKNEVLHKFNLNNILFTVVIAQSLKWNTYWRHVLCLVYKTQPTSKPGVLGDNLVIKRDCRVKFTKYLLLVPRFKMPELLPQGRNGFRSHAVARVQLYSCPCALPYGYLRCSSIDDGNFKFWVNLCAK